MGLTTWKRRAAAGLASGLLYWLLLDRLVDLATLAFAPVQRDFCQRMVAHACTRSGSAGAGAAGNGSELQVVLPSVGQTGTSTVVEALKSLGLRAYHVDETSLFVPEIMWDPGDEAAHMDEVYRSAISRCHLDGLSLEPVTDTFPLALGTSPSARVILTWRDHPSWVRSSLAVVEKDLRRNALHGSLLKGVRVLPWLEMLQVLTGTFSSHISEGRPFSGPGEQSLGVFLLKRRCNLYAGPLVRVASRGTFKIALEEESYLAHMDEIRRLTPPDRLLVLDLRRHGWAELAAFLRRPAPRRCCPGGRGARALGSTTASGPTTPLWSPPALPCSHCYTW